ncbi:MAG: nucleotide exchange factor GrpE [Erysipelotrichaceae bacterium]|jgi:molecular chaperone GrpE|nr:nucleotide exchange factor GrpE [Erysipelotrichaceae bacterium]
MRSKKKDEMKDRMKQETIVEENTQNVAGEEIAPVDEMTEKNLRIAELEGEVVKLKNDFYKAYADADNMKKRLQNDFDTRMKYRIQSFALDILPVIDNLERALGSDASEGESLRKGIEMTYAQLIEALRKEGVEEIEALNQPFDHNLHHALLLEAKEGVEKNIVIEVLQKGYKLKDRILRASLVKVSE